MMPDAIRWYDQNVSDVSRRYESVASGARMFGEPSLHLLGLVGLVVVADRMHVEVLGYGSHIAGALRALLLLRRR